MKASNYIDCFYEDVCISIHCDVKLVVAISDGKNRQEQLKAAQRSLVYCVQNYRLTDTVFKNRSQIASFSSDKCIRI